MNMYRRKRSAIVARCMVSDQGGKSNFINELERRGIPVAKSDPRLDTLIALVKEHTVRRLRL